MPLKKKQDSLNGVSKEDVAFRAQLWFLTRRISLYHRMIGDYSSIVESSPRSVFILDRCVWDDVVFANALHKFQAITDQDWELYQNVYNSLENLLPLPELVIFLDVSPQTLLERIRVRKRGMEQQISTEYLEQIECCYKDFLKWVDGHGVKTLIIKQNEFLGEVQVQSVTDAIECIFGLIKKNE